MYHTHGTAGPQRQVGAAADPDLTDEKSDSRPQLEPPARAPENQFKRNVILAN